MIDQLNSLLQISFLAKIFVLVLSLFYFVFTAVVYREISLMTNTLNSSISPTIRLLAKAQIIAGAVLFLLAVVIA